MKRWISFGVLGLALFSGSCVPYGKVTGIVSENQALNKRNAELEEEVARLENLIFFLESEIRYANRDKEKN
jgi:hypothetical protein